MARAQATPPQYAWIGVADTSGKVVLAAGGLLEGRDVSERPWFQSARSQPFAGDVHLAKLLASLLPASASGAPLRFVDFAASLRDWACTPSTKPRADGPRSKSHVEVVSDVLLRTSVSSHMQR